LRRKVTFFVISGDEGRVRKITVSLFLIRFLVFSFIVFFSAVCFMIYDYRGAVRQKIELMKLREIASKQKLMLSFFEDKFRRVESEVSRLRVIDSRIKKLIRIQEPRKRSQKAYIGGKEYEDGELFLTENRLVRLRIEELEKGILVDLTKLEGIKDMLETRLEVLESMPTRWPVRGVISSGFGARISPFTRRTVFHRGLDIQAPMGAEVRAAGSGRVVRSSFDPTYGNIVVIDHGSGYRTIYAHMSENLVKLGDYVERGQVIGRVGTTGRSTGPHLHFEIRVNGVPTNPIRYLG